MIWNLDVVMIPSEPFHPKCKIVPLLKIHQRITRLVDIGHIEEAVALNDATHAVLFSAGLPTEAT